MGTTNWDEYVAINNLRPRLYGGDIPAKVIKSAFIIQKMWRSKKNSYKQEVSNFIKLQKDIKLNKKQNKKSSNRRFRKNKTPNYLRNTLSSSKKFNNKVFQDKLLEKPNFRF